MAVFLTACSSRQHTKKPNVMLIFIDDMGWGDFSCFGNEDAHTPNIDKMATEGICFEQFYVNSPICSPSRVAISTGRYPQRYQITSYLAHRDQNEQRGLANWLDPAAPLLARSLQNAGYATGHFGKWHMGGQRDVTEAPAISEYGFDESLTNFEGLGAKLLPLTKDETGKVDSIWKNAVNLGEPVTWMQRSEITTGFIDAAIPFMEKALTAGKPFYINLWPDDVHSPYWPPFEEYGLAKDAGKRALYLAVLEAMDEQFGKVFDYIQSSEVLRNNTLILICSDNGPELGAGKAGILKGYKTHLYEGGIRSPLIVWGPDFLKQKARGTRNTESVFSAIDLVPSLLDFTGSEAPEQANFDGENLITTLLGESKKSREAPLFFSRPPDRKNYYGFENLPDLAMRADQWKLLCDYDGGRPELYDILADPGETNNLISSEKEIEKSMTEELLGWWNQMPSQVNYRVHTFYYGWYGNPEYDGDYAHWNHKILPHGPDPRWIDAGHYPGGEDIGANFYPELGTYSSNDPEIISKHMEMIKEAGIGVLAFSWWGKNASEEQSLMSYFDIADQYGLKITFHIEPFYRSIEEFRDLLSYISGKYGDHPALYKFNGKPLYYVYDSYKHSSDEWRKILDPAGVSTVRNTALDGSFIGIWVLRTSGDFFLSSGFDGFYTYYASDKYVYGSNPDNWAELADFAEKHELIFIPSVGPGYIDTRIRPWNVNTTVTRDHGKYYENMFQRALAVNPEFISITSFNEWHEGTQIEPAIPKSIPRYSYEDYGPEVDPWFYLKKTKELIKGYGN